MNKFSYIHSLEDVKLVLGNGYDLHCKLHSSYKDYVRKNKDLFKHLEDITNKYKIHFDKCVSFSKNPTFRENNIESINIWDFIFALATNFNGENSLWCDIEKIIKHSLDDKILYYIVSLPNVLKTIQEKKTDSRFNEDLLASFIIHKKDIKSIYRSEDFYKFLFDELKLFEVQFGLFIKRQRMNIDNSYFNYGMKNDKYEKCATETLKSLCNIDSVVSVDNFNFDDCGIEQFAGIERNINGNVEAPIFGIDSVYSPSDCRIMFTKTYRRILDDMCSLDTKEMPSFKNVIIYGHSLDESDYSYFFPIFDKIKIFDPIEKGVVVFAFTIYDLAKEEKIKDSLNKSIYKIIENYALYKGYSDKDKTRFIDYLSTQKRILMYEIPELKEPRYNYASMFDSGFVEKI